MPCQPRLLEYAIDFFCTFQRFEFALKETGYFKRTVGRAEPDWDGFAAKSEIKHLFSPLSSDPVVKYILENPPKKQVVVCANGGTHTVQWCPERKPTNMKELILGVRRTRNNLFHGGKSLTGPIEQAERNEKLIRAAHAVLREMLKSDSDLKSCFEQTDI